MTTVRCAHCRLPIEDRTRAWRARTVDRPYADQALHAECVPAFREARNVRSVSPPLRPGEPKHAVWCRQRRGEACNCGGFRPSRS